MTQQELGQRHEGQTGEGHDGQTAGARRHAIPLVAVVEPQGLVVLVHGELPDPAAQAVGRPHAELGLSLEIDGELEAEASLRAVVFHPKEPLGGIGGRGQPPRIFADVGAQPRAAAARGAAGGEREGDGCERQPGCRSAH